MKNNFSYQLILTLFLVVTAYANPHIEEPLIVPNKAYGIMEKEEFLDFQKRKFESRNENFSQEQSSNIYDAIIKVINKAENN